MINAIPPHRPVQKFIKSACILFGAGFALAASTTAFADDDRPLSALGIERGLQLYDDDVADRCILGYPQIRLTVNNVHREGILKIELFGEKNFMKSSGKLRRIRIPAEDGPMKVCIHVPAAPGDYAIVAYHDVDGDRKLDKKWNFKPKEPFGLSNDPVIESLRLPRWEETRFPVASDGTEITMNLVDPD